MKAVLDTSVVIAPDIPLLAGELAVSAATVAELHFGVLVARNATIRAARLRRLSALREHFEPLPVDAAVAVSYGELAAVADAGRQPRARVMDLLIAATAHAHDARLYTRHAKDFVGVTDLVEVIAV
jgi:predicted nucleic acid-binding protein